VAVAFDVLQAEVDNSSPSIVILNSDRTALNCRTFSVVVTLLRALQGTPTQPVLHRRNPEERSFKITEESVKEPQTITNQAAQQKMVLAAFRSTKVEHPSGDHSLHVSEKVQEMHQQYLGFQKNLNNLVLLYRTRHQLMDALNENGLYVSNVILSWRCMLSSLPIVYCVLIYFTPQSKFN